MEVTELTKYNLYKAVDRATELNATYFAIIVNLGDGFSETIINKLENVIKNKLDYWDESYDNDLRLKRNRSISIIGFTYGDTYDEICKFLEQ